MIQGEITKKRMEQWKFRSPEEEGFHEVIGPQKADCEAVFIYRLNLSRGKTYILYTKDYCKVIQDGQVLRDNAMISPSKYEPLFYEKAAAPQTFRHAYAP